MTPRVRKPSSPQIATRGAVRSLVESGWQQARQRIALVGIGLGLSWLTAILFAGFSWMWLERALGDSLPTRTLLTDLDVHVVIDLLVHHRHSMRMLVGQGVLIAAIGLGAWIWLQAATAMAVSSTASLRECSVFGRAHLGRYASLWLMSAAITGAGLMAIVAVARWVERWSVIETSTGGPLALQGAAVAAGLSVYVLVTTWHDHVRIHCALADTRTGPAMLWALRFVLRNALRAAGLTLLCLATNAALLAVYHLASDVVTSGAAFSVPLALVLGQAWVVTRIFLRIWLAASAAALQALEEGLGDSEQLALLPVE